MTRQFPVLNGLRGIAALGILAHHLTIYFFPELGQYAAQFSPFFNKNYLWVDFFFILSGFVISHAYGHFFNKRFSPAVWWTFLYTRFIRLYPLHFAVLLCFILVECTYLYTWHAGFIPVPLNNPPLPPFDSEYSGKALLLNLLFLQSLPRWSSWNGPSWAISAMWLTSFLLPFFLHRTRHLQRWTSLLLILPCMGVITFVYILHGTLDVLSWGGLVRCMFESIIGILLYSILRKNKNLNILQFNLGYLLLFLATLVSMVLPINDLVTVIAFCPLILLGAQVETMPFFTHPLLLFLGKLSFALYMTHWFFFQLLDKISVIQSGIVMHRHFTPLQLTMISLIILLTSLTVSYLAYKYFECPVGRILKKYAP